MGTNEISTIVDKLAEKAGLVATQLRPVADEVIRQYVVRSAISAAGFAVLLIAFSVALYMHIKRNILKKEEYTTYRSNDGQWILAIVLALGVVGNFIWMVDSISSAVAPLVGLLQL